MAKAYKPNQAYIIDIPGTRNVMDEAIDSIKENETLKKDEVDLNQLKQKLNNWKKRSFKKR